LYNIKEKIDCKYIAYDLFKNNKNYISLLLINTLTALFGIIIYKLIDNTYENNEIFVFTYYRRILSFLSPISLCGMGVTLAKKVSLKKTNSLQYFIISLFMTVILPILLLLFYFISPKSLTLVLWGNNPNDFGSMFLPLILNLFGLNSISIIISYYRGKDRFIKASSIGLIFVSIVPLLILLLDVAIEQFLVIFGLSLIGSTLIFIILKIKHFHFDKDINIKSYIKEGILRIAGDVSYYFLLLAPSYFILLFTKDLVSAAAIGFCQVIINSSSILINPISFITLTKSVRFSINRELNELKKVFNRTITYTFLIFTFFSIILILLTEHLILILYSKEILLHLFPVKIFLLVTPFIATYLSGRSFIDGVTAKPIMSRINASGLATFFLIMMIAKEHLTVFSSITVGFISSFIIMDFLMISYIKKL
jgi:O-antigen/teichoic acid export membrane protein